MSDSQEFFIPIPPMPDEEYQACCYPFNALRPFDQYGEATNPFLRWSTVKGHVPSQSFKIKGVWCGNPLDSRLAGYLVKVNLSCATGHNILLRNGVPRAVELAFLQAKCWLKDRGCTYLGLDKLDLEKVVLHSVTPTYLHRRSSIKAAKAARDDFRTVARLRNIKSPSGKARTKRAFSTGDGEDDTAYLKDRETPLGGYVKDRHSEVEHVFSSDKLRDEIFDEGELYFRLEPTLGSAYLRRNKLTRVEDWRMYGSDKAYRDAYAVIRKLLRLDDDLRIRKPQEEHLKAAKLAPLHLEVLRWHLDDDPKHQARNHPAILDKQGKLAQQQYFSAVKVRVWLKLRIDLSIPWERQAAAAATKLGDLLHYPGMYEPPERLSPHVFGIIMAAQLLHELKVKLDTGRPKGIGRTHIPPELRAAPVVPLGQIVVQPTVREFLDKADMPLYPFLEAHKAGVFGDLSRDEILAAAEAAAAGQAVQSRYKVGDGWVIVQTCPRAQGGDSVTTVRHTF